MIQFTSSQAEKYRAIINKAADNLTDDDAAYAPMLFERWTTETAYEVGKRVCYNDKLYKVLQAHTSQSDWTPDVATSLFAEVLIPDPSVIPEWVQPSSTNPYMTGDKVRYQGHIWICTVDYNVWPPDEYGWEMMDN